MLVLSEHLREGHRQAGELAAALGIERSTLVRAFEREPELLRLGRARATVYALPTPWPGLDRERFPVHRIDAAGEPHTAGELLTLAAAESIWLPGLSIAASLPAPLHDIAPRGFLGRSFARRHADLALPEDVTAWSDHHVLIALARRGEDLPGNLVVGDESLERFRSLTPTPITIDDFRSHAEAAMAGEHAGSSAGGEQPKFTAFYEGEHRIIKFASATTDNARRWQDLLALERLAANVLRDHGIDAAEAELIDRDGMRYLIVRRFDRVGAHGRRSVVTLAAATLAIDGALNQRWTNAAESIAIRTEDRERIALLDDFGALIANTDRHLYNIALFNVDGLRLAPSFDQLPMAYAPPASGNLRTTPVELPAASTTQAHSLALDYWQRATDCTHISDAMRVIAAHHRDALSAR